MIRKFGVTVVSLILTVAVIANAYYQKKQFYPSVVYITKSNPSMAVIYIQAFIFVIIFGKLMRKLFFGELRAAEFEHLMERSWYAITETCLAFTVFRDDFSPKFVALFTLLLFLKSFHWLAEDRVDFMERSPVISFLFHVRILSLLIMLGALDLHFVGHAYQSTLTKGASVQLVFGFEYAILWTITFNIAVKYILHSIDLHSDGPWDNKAVFLLYTELIMGFIKVVLYVLFVFIMVRIYTLPLFAFRPMYYTMRAFKKAFNDVLLSRRAIRNMNTLYPDATPEELAAADNVCIICREDMRSGSKKLPCNHIFHTACLRSWFQRQQTCPTCRLNILRTPEGPGNVQQGGNQNAPAQGNVPPPPPPPPQRQPDNRNPLQNQTPNYFPFPWNRNMQPQHPQQQRNMNQSENDNGAESTEASTSSETPHIYIPKMEDFRFICPPFPFMPYTVPAPTPPTGGLSEEELRQMEMQGIAGIEARLRCLKNIQHMLDASVVMMQQYTAAAAASQRLEHFESETTSAPSTSSQPHAQEFENSENSSAPAEDQNLPGPSTSKEDSRPQKSSSTWSCNRANNISEQEEARKRRLAKFSQQNQL